MEEDSCRSAAVSLLETFVDRQPKGQQSDRPSELDACARAEDAGGRKNLWWANLPDTRQHFAMMATKPSVGGDGSRGHWR